MIYRQNAWVLEMQTFTQLTWRGGCTSYRRFSQLKFLRCITKFSCSAVHALHMREVHYKVMRRSCNRPVLHLLFNIIQQIKQKQSLLTGKTLKVSVNPFWFGLFACYLTFLPASGCCIKNKLSCLEKNFLMAGHGISFNLLTISNTQNLQRENKNYSCGVILTKD